MLHRRKYGIGFVVDHKCGSDPSERPDILEMIKAQKELFSTVLPTCLSQRCIGFLKCSSFEAACTPCEIKNSTFLALNEPGKFTDCI